MRDELITKWKNSLVLNDEKELFEDIEAKVHNEEFVELIDNDIPEEVIELVANDVPDEFVELVVEEPTIEIINDEENLKIQAFVATSLKLFNGTDRVYLSGKREHLSVRHLFGKSHRNYRVRYLVFRILCFGYLNVEDADSDGFEFCEDINYIVAVFKLYVKVDVS